MVQTEQMLEALMAMMPSPERIAASGGAPTDSDVDDEVRKVLGSSGIDPDGVVTIAQNIVHMAVAQGQEPEDTVLGAFAMGAAMVCVLHKKGALQ